ncbi:DUF4870 domain-containing protein [Glaciibacter sp. 2TAF33]|uniref:DUF4870 domain-containing protein n=1 Tax=Glaciibacter sp. 2TAF33 TaxID=3233015 RepID=UPI003F906267
MSDSQPGPQDPGMGQQPQQPYQPQAPVAAPPLTEADDRQWASFAHLGGILSFLPSLIIWLVFKDRGRFTEVEAKEALNFQITLVIGYVAINIIGIFLALVTFGIGGVFSLLVWVLWVVGVIFSILGFMKAKDGEHYRYPFALRLIK